MSLTNTVSSIMNDTAPGHELFALTDEQILEIEPETQTEEIHADRANANGQVGAKTKADSSPSLGMTSTADGAAEPRGGSRRR